MAKATRHYTRNAAERLAGESKSKAVPKTRRRRKPASESPAAPEKVPGLSYPVMDGEDMFEKLGRLRHEAELEIDRLIDFLDRTCAYAMTELEEACDDVPCDDDELEPSLGWTLGVDQAGRYFATAPWAAWDVDLEDEHDGREPDVDDEEDDPGEDNGDQEPSLGWTVDGTLGSATTFFVVDGEMGGHGVAELDKRRQAYRNRRAAKPDVRDDESNVEFVLVNRNRRGAGYCNVRPLTPAEQMHYLGSTTRPAVHPTDH